MHAKFVWIFYFVIQSQYCIGPSLACVRQHFNSIELTPISIYSHWQNGIKCVEWLQIACEENRKLWRRPAGHQIGFKLHCKIDKWLPNCHRRLYDNDRISESNGKNGKLLMCVRVIGVSNFRWHTPFLEMALRQWKERQNYAMNCRRKIQKQWPNWRCSVCLRNVQCHQYVRA